MILVILWNWRRTRVSLCVSRVRSYSGVVRLYTGRWGTDKYKWTDLWMQFGFILKQRIDNLHRQQQHFFPFISPAEGNQLNHWIVTTDWYKLSVCRWQLSKRTVSSPDSVSEWPPAAARWSPTWITDGSGINMLSIPASSWQHANRARVMNW